MRKISYVTLVLLSMLFAAAFASADHTTTVTISPNTANCNDVDATYTVNVANEAGSGSSIREVRIYDDYDFDGQRDDGIVTFECGPAPTGWTLTDRLALYNYCQYETTLAGPDKIAPGSDLDFTFTASFDDTNTECGNFFRVSSIDDLSPVGTVVFKFPFVQVDCTDPVLVKTVGMPKIACDSGCDWWISDMTEIDFVATDDESICDLGIDYCRYRTKLDDNPWTSWTNVNAIEAMVEFQLQFNEDSNHYIEVECYDLAGNVVTLSEHDRVDMTPPKTNGIIGGPQKFDGKSLWIDTANTITLTAHDPDPTGEGCNIGVEKTWYVNVLDESEESCWNKDKEACKELCPSPYDNADDAACIEESQAYCKDNWEDDMFASWEDCVEMFVYKECDINCLGDMWRLYRGVPIQKDEESCHVLHSFSVDYLANSEDLNYMCFFVDKTPPELQKSNGDAIPDRGEDDFMTPENPEGAFHWLTTDMPIQFKCADQEPHPSGDEVLCYKVGLDGADVTAEYCDIALSPDGYCCVDVHDKVFDFYFKEETKHSLEYFCMDAVEKKTDTHIQYYKVDDTPPAITKAMFGSWLGDCPPMDELDVCYVSDNGESGVNVTVEDPGMCASDMVECYYELWWEDVPERPIASGEFGTEMDLVFTEDSNHTLIIVCEDALGNSVNDTEIFLVDSTPPVTKKTYGEPFKIDPDCVAFFEDVCTDSDDYEACVEEGTHAWCTMWITSGTPVTLEAEDEKVGVDTIYYRNLYFPENNEICGRDWQLNGIRAIEVMPRDPCNPDYYMQYINEEIPFTEYTEPFFKTEDSCHVIEYYSVDRLGNAERPKWQCVYVDNQAPEGIKTVGEPKLECAPVFNGGECDDEGFSRTYTLDADFAEGTLNGVEYISVPDQLQVSFEGLSTYPTLWVANSGGPTLSKWDTETNREIARYYTWFMGSAGGSHSGPAPSRTAVDVDGNVYVANRHFDNNKPAEVMKILTDDFIDRNSNGVADTSSDLNNDGLIEPAEMMPLVDSNANNKIDEDEIQDERIAWVVQVGTGNCLGRSLAIDLDGNIWLGCYNTQDYYKLSSEDGSLLAGPISVAGHTPYGAMVDKYGILWGASLSTNLLRLDTSDNSYTILNHAGYGGNYGIALGYDEFGNTQVYLGTYSGYTYIHYDSGTATFSNPAELQYTVRGIATDKDGNIVAGSGGGNLGSGGVAKFAPDGSLIWQAASQVGPTEARGTVVDNNNDIWLVHVSADKISKFDGTDGSPLGVWPTDRYPYTYSDATGLGLRGSIPAGTWSVVHDTGAAGSALGPVSWNAQVPEGTQLTVRVRSSEDGLSWSAWENVANGNPFSSTPDARYMQVEVFMKTDGEISPVLYDLTINAGCSVVQDEYECWWVRDHVTPIKLECNDPEPHPVAQETVCYQIEGDENVCTEIGSEAFEALDLPEENIVEVATGAGSFDILVAAVVAAGLDGALSGDGPFTVFAPTDDAFEQLASDLGVEVEDLLELPNLADILLYHVLGQGSAAGDVVASNCAKTLNGLPVAFSLDGGVFVNDAEIVATDVAASNGVIHVIDKVILPMDLTALYCMRFGGEMKDGWCCAYAGDGPYEFTFTEDCNHALSFYCMDHLGNTGETDKEYFKVDSVPPTTTKTYLGPYHEDDGMEWIDTASTIRLDAVDGGEFCAVGGVKTWYWYGLVDDEACRGACEPVGDVDWMEYEGAFGIPDESCHIIQFYSEDALGNTEDMKYQCVFVDKSPPTIEKEYVGPYFNNDGVEYINSLTMVEINAEDSEPHPSGIESIEYRVTLVDDTYCAGEAPCDAATGSGSWSSYLEPFSINEESCHLIEVSAVDNVGKSAMHKQCVFVDNTPPTPIKTVHQPRAEWRPAPGEPLFYPDIVDKCWDDPENPTLECWKIVLTTPIDMKCDDPEPHPVAHEEVCFRVEVDAVDVTESYCDIYSAHGSVFDKYEDGYCCVPSEIESFYFTETCEHNLEYYCVDKLGNSNREDTDDEKFKVEDTQFEIELNKKWNLISVPVQLLDDSIGEVFSQCADEVISVWTYDAVAKQWYVYSPDGDDTNDDLHTMLVGDGYWVLADAPCKLVIGGSLMKPGAHVPPTKPIVGDDWNLVGYFGAEGQPGYYGPAGNGKEAQCVFQSLGDDIWDFQFASLWSYWEPLNPDTWIPFTRTMNMDPGAGYWVYATEGGNYVPPTACWWD